MAYDAALYALIHRGTPGDRTFYADACKGAATILELGCGYGRLIPTLITHGANYRGLDLDPTLLRLARQLRNTLPLSTRSRIKLSLGDMRSFHFRQRFDRILIPHSALYCLPNDKAVLSCLRTARDHLSPNGELILDAYSADAFHDELDPSTMTGSERDFITTAELDHKTYQVFERTRWHRKTQRLIVNYDYEPDHGPTRSGRIVHRYLLRPQLESLMKHADLEITALHGDFQGTRFKKHSEHLIIRATQT